MVTPDEIIDKFTDMHRQLSALDGFAPYWTAPEIEYIIRHMEENADANESESDTGIQDPRT